MLRVEGEEGLGLKRDDRKKNKAKKQNKQMYKTVRKAAVLKLNNIFYAREVE